MACDREEGAVAADGDDEGGPREGIGARCRDPRHAWHRAREVTKQRQRRDVLAAREVEAKPNGPRLGVVGRGIELRWELLERL